MEKRAIIEEGWTPPEKADKDLAEHLTKRAADAAHEQIAGGITRATLHDAMKVMTEQAKK